MGKEIRWRQLAAVVAVVGFSIALRWRIASIPLERDEGEYAYIAERWLSGGVPYRDAFDQKPPGIFVAYAAPLALGLRSTEAIHWLGHAALLGTLVFVVLIGRRLGSHVIGVLAALCLTVLAMDAPVLGSAANTEVFAILPLSACVYFCLRAADRGLSRDALLAGVAGGVALCFKQVCLLVVASLLGWMAVAVKRGWRVAAQDATESEASVGPWRLAAAFSLGAGAVVLVPVLYFAAHGAWGAFIDCVIGNNLAYSARIPWWAYPGNFVEGFAQVVASQWPVWAAAGVAVAALASSRARDVRTVLPVSPQALGVCVVWWLGSLLAVSVGGYYRDHYFILLMPPTALLAASALTLAARSFERKRIERQVPLAAVLTVLALAWPLASSIGYYTSSDPRRVARSLYGTNPFVESPEVGRLLREKSQAGDRVFILGSEPQILFYAQRESASRYIYVYPLFAGGREVAPRQQSVLDELRGRPPKLVVIVASPMSFLAVDDAPNVLFEGLYAMLSRSYHPLANTAIAADGSYRMIRADRTPENERQLGPNEMPTLAIWERND